MKKILIFTLLFSNLLLSNCNKEEKKLEKNSTEISKTNDEKEDIDIKFSDETYTKLEIFSKNKEKVIEKLKSLNKEEADRLYDKYLKENEKFCVDLMVTENFFYDSTDYTASEIKEKFQKVKKFFNKYGLTLLDTQGGFFLHIPSSFYYPIFKDYVSDEYRDYLELTFKDDETEVTYMPTGMVLFEYNSIKPLTIQEIGDKILAFRNFLDKHPNTKFKEIFAVYVFYILDYTEFSLSYKENEEGIEIPEDYYKISDENMKEYKKFIENNPNELASKCLKYLLENYKNTKSDVIGENIITILKKEMKKEFNVTDLWGL